MAPWEDGRRVDSPRTDGRDLIRHGDESEQAGLYLYVMCWSPTQRVVERQLRDVRLPHQRRLHTAHETDQRKRHLLQQMSALDAGGVALRRRRTASLSARTLCLASAVELALEHASKGLVLERQEGGVKRDLAVIAQTLAGRTLRHEFVEPHEHPLLWMPDAAAWAIGKGSACAAPLLPNIRVIDI